MKLVGSAHQVYSRHIKPKLPLSVQRALRTAVMSWPSRIVRHVSAELDYWRVTRPATRLLGPQYLRARRLIEIDITYACNLNCYNCNRSCEQAPTGEHMTVQQIEAFLKESTSRGLHWERIRLLGGEPTVHKHFFEILDLVRAYKRDFSPETMIEVITNGHGDKVNAAIEKIPSDVVISNTSKETKVQPTFGSFNVAPKDRTEYALADFSNGCWIIKNCGMGLGPSGYYPCAVAGGIDRIFGWDLGRKTLPADDDDMHDLLEKFCQHCGHFKRRLEPTLDGPLMSPTWREAYERYRRRRPKLTKYAGEADTSAAPVEPESPTALPRQVQDGGARPTP
jgi:hypothetical protein